MAIHRYIDTDVDAAELEVEFKNTFTSKDLRVVMSMPLEVHMHSIEHAFHGTCIRWNMHSMEHVFDGTCIRWNTHSMEHVFDGTYIRWNTHSMEHVFDETRIWGLPRVRLCACMNVDMWCCPLCLDHCDTVLTLPSYGLYSYGLCSYGLCSSGLCRGGLYSYGRCSHGLCRHGL